jgi:MoaA/NifB/PqqE/SkfB family radical SAM enzyme
MPKVSVYRKMKHYSLEKFTTSALSLLANASDEQLIRLTHLAEKIPRKESYRRKIRWIRELFKGKHPGLQVAKRIVKETNPHHRRKIITNVIINQLLVGTNRRKEFEAETGVYPPDALLMSPTMRCNLSCDGCYSADYPQGEEMELETMDRVIAEGKEMGIHLVFFTGGEPFLREDIFELFEKHGDVGFQVYTNATLIDEKMVDRFAQLGNVMPAISVEGLQEHTDLRRGEGRFERDVQVMDLLKAAGLFFAVSTTQTRHNTDILTSDEFIDLLVEKGCILMWNFYYVPIGRDPDLNMMATPRQRNQMRERLGYFRATKPMLFVDFWNDGHLTHGCIAGGRKYLHINARGDVEPCVFCHFASDNIREKSLLEVLTSPLFKEIRARQPFSENHMKPCMLIDNPHQGRDLALNYASYFTHPSARALFTDLAPHIDRYAQEYEMIADAHGQELYAEEEELEAGGKHA